MHQATACWRAPLTPFPGEVVWCLNTTWLKGGTEAQRVPGLDIGAGLTLLLDTGPALHAVATEALRQALANATPLLLALGQAHQYHQVHKTGDRYGKQALLWPAVLGLLLAKLGSSRGDYMRENPYWVGRLLSLADRLHLNYCRHERRGQVPPQLLGNALMPTALENPLAGLARLSERLPLYYRCADRDLRAALAEVEQAIDRGALRDRSSEMEKAQMLLGYLARPDLLTAPASGPIPEGEQP
jgi:hypothetical protein